MKTEIDVHSVQAQILRVLLFKPKARFAQLNVEELSTDHFTFHVKQLVTSGLIRKNDEGSYELTTKGKEFANHFDTDKVSVEPQAKIGVLIVATKKEGKVKKYLIQQRLKQPYYGFHGCPGGKVRKGETVFEAAGRELKEETGLEGKLKLKAVKHKMDYSPEGALLEDKFFFLFVAENLSEKLIENFEGGRNLWLTEKEIYKLPKLFKDVAQSIKYAKGKELQFSEKKYIEEVF